MNQEGNEEKFVCVWLNTQSNLPKEYINAQDNLRTIINFFRNYNDLNQCVDFIININTNIKIILIVVDQLAEKKLIMLQGDVNKPMISAQTVLGLYDSLLHNITVYSLQHFILLIFPVYHAITSWLVSLKFIRYSIIRAANES